MNRKEIIRQYKETVQPMGVYQVKNLANGKVFIAGGMNLQGKINSCRFQLAHGSHMNWALQDDFTRFGSSRFSFEIIDTLEPKEDKKQDYRPELETLEKMWIEKLQPYGDKGYNRKKDK